MVDLLIKGGKQNEAGGHGSIAGVFIAALVYCSKEEDWLRLVDGVWHAPGACCIGTLFGEFLRVNDGGIYSIESHNRGDGNGFRPSGSGSFVRFENFFNGVVDGPLKTVVHYNSPLSKRYKLTGLINKVRKKILKKVLDEMMGSMIYYKSCC